MHEVKVRIIFNEYF